MNLMNMSKSHSKSYYGNISHDQSLLENSSLTPATDFRNFMTRKILRQGQLTKHMIAPIGNPDEALPRRGENRFLLRLCYAIACWLNNRCGAEIERRYFERNLVGKFCRVILARPQIYFVVEKKRGHLPSKVYHHLPPRVSLRFLASSETWLYMLPMICAAVYFKLSPLGTLCWGLTLAFFYVLCRMRINSKTAFV